MTEHVYPVIFSEAGTCEGHLAYVRATSPGAAQDQCNDAVRDEGGIWDGCNFTIWPEPVPTN